MTHLPASAKLGQIGQDKNILLKTMTQILKTTLYSLLTIVLSGFAVSCSVSVILESPIEVKRLVFLNKTSRPLKNVRIYVAKTREFISCNYILANSECSTGFPLREYQGNSFEVSWMDGDQQKSAADIKVSIPGNLNKDKPVKAVIVFSKEGIFSADLQH